MTNVTDWVVQMLLGAPYRGASMAQYGFAPGQGIDRTTAVMASPLFHEFENNRNRLNIATAMEQHLPGLGAALSGAPSENIEDRRTPYGTALTARRVK